MEYEPEWESAFNLHVKLAHSITLALEWCSAERSLAATAYRMALRRHADTCAARAHELRGECGACREPDIRSYVFVSVPRAACHVFVRERDTSRVPCA